MKTAIGLACLGALACLVAVWKFALPTGLLTTTPEMRIGALLPAYAEAQWAHRAAGATDSAIPAYASDYRTLCSAIPPSGGARISVRNPAAFAAARGASGSPYLGYVFLEPRKIDGEAVDWKSECALVATPREYGRSGLFTMMIFTDGAVWAKDLGEAILIDDCPRDPGAQGWSRR